MLLITKAQQQTLMANHPLAMEGTIKALTIPLKLFMLSSGWTAYIISQDPGNNDLLYGIVTGPGWETELGYFSLKEITALKWHGIPRVERDRGFKPRNAKEVWENANNNIHM